MLQLPSSPQRERRNRSQYVEANQQAGAGAATSVQVPTLRCKLQIWFGPVQGTLQQTPSVQMSEAHWSSSLHGAPSGNGVLVGVAVAVGVAGMSRPIDRLKGREYFVHHRRKGLGEPTHDTREPHRHREATLGRCRRAARQFEAQVVGVFGSSSWPDLPTLRRPQVLGGR